MNKLLLHLVFVLSAFSGNAQEMEVSKQEILKIFRENMAGSTHGWRRSSHSRKENEMHYLNYNVWMTANDDSAYYKDEIEMYNYDGYYKLCQCTNTMEWHLSTGYKLNYRQANPDQAAVVPEYSHRIRVKEKDGVITLFIIGLGGKRETFEVLSFSKVYLDSKEVYVMKLKRIRD